MRYRIFYAKNATFLENPDLAVEDLTKSHVFLRKVEADSLDQVWRAMQGENQSPNGESCELIQARGLCHTSMSVGDVIQAGDEYYQIAFVGFRKLTGRRVSVEQKRKAKDIILEAMEEPGSEFWKDGYTPEMVTPGCLPLQKAAKIVGLPGSVSLVWAFLDVQGFGGNSDLCYVERMAEGGVSDGPARQAVGIWSLSMPYCKYQNGQSTGIRGVGQKILSTLWYV